jgi:hypothetical protein
LRLTGEIAERHNQVEQRQACALEPTTNMNFFNLFIQNPAWIALISGLFFGAYGLLRNKPDRRSRALFVSAAAW